MKLDRRQFFRVTAVGGAAASLDACSSAIPTSRPRRHRGPESRVVTACGACGAGCGISARVVGDNVVQIEGVADHPVNGGAVCARGIAEIQNLYHPERLRAPQARPGRDGTLADATWEAGLERFGKAARAGKVVIGVGDCPAGEVALVERLAAALGAVVVEARPPHAQPPHDAEHALLGAEGYRYDLAHAEYVLTLGADWLAASPSPMETQRAYAAIRRRRDGRGLMVTASPRLSITAGKSHRWIPVRSDQLYTFGLAVARAIIDGGGVANRDYPGYQQLAGAAADERYAPARVAEELRIEPGHIERVARELASRKHAVVVTDRSDSAVQWVGVALNLLIGAVGREGGMIAASADAALPSELVPSRRPKRVERFPAELDGAAVLLYRCNPLYALPVSSGWRTGLERASLVANVSSYLDETAQVSDVVLPPSTAFETRQLTWGATGGGVGFVTGGPAVVEPLYDTRSGIDILLGLAGSAGVKLPWKDTDEYLSAVAEALGAGDAAGGGFAILGPAGAVEVEEEGTEEAPAEGEAAEGEAAEGEAAEGEAAKDLPDEGKALGAAVSPIKAAEAVADVQPHEAGELAAETLPARPAYRYTTGAWPVPAPAAASPNKQHPLLLEVHEPGAFHGGLGAHLPYLHGLTDAYEREVWRTVVEVHAATARAAGITDGDLVSVTSPTGAIEAIARVREGIRPDTVAIATGLGRRGMGIYCDGHGANPLDLVGESGPTFVRMEKRS